MMDIILIGAFDEILELCELCNFHIVGIIDKNSQGNIGSYRILGCDDEAERISHLYPNVPVLIVPDKPQLRKRLAEYYRLLNFKFTNLVSSKAILSPSASIGIGVVIQSCASISANAKIKDFVKINIGATVMHDSLIGRYSTIAPNAVILGRVKIDECTYIGSNATILSDLSIGQGCVIGAGSVVTTNLPDYTIVAGNPAKPIHKSGL
jgi:sugar O-acyltransferase (sialic acid O-acetyltransferase NeuD family)